MCIGDIMGCEVREEGDRDRVRLRLDSDDVLDYQALLSPHRL